MDERDIFMAALEYDALTLQAAYVDKECTGNPALRERVEALLRSHRASESFLQVETSGDAPTLAPPIAEKPGTQIGPYKLLEKIGEGGMGVVYMAAQKEPIRRKVALKIIKPGMDTQEVVTRFEAERHALALMDHQSIARVLDGGSTESGRPYFVMELVEGTPVDEYCDACRYTTRQRLKLFVQVCQAVHHAHQKGIIHRDIKPPNILVTNADDKALPKVIDFGIAKAIHQQLTDQSLYTHFAQMIGTPMYMSPEQARCTSQDVDTRSDVYSLGVVLYELLTGATPFDKERLHKSSLDEVKRIIREEEPPKPSTCLSTPDAALETIAEKHHTDQRTLAQQIRGELDWIVMKALDKDRNRRYESANDFMRDIQRYLDDQPVEACPPSAIYRSRKFVRRNRVVLGIVATVAVAFAVVCLSLVVAYRVRAESLQTRLDLQAAEAARRAEKEIRLAAEKAQESARLDTLLLKGLQQSIEIPPNFPAAIKSLTEVIDNRPDDAAAYLHRGSTYYRWGRAWEAIQDLGQALKLSPKDNLAAHKLMAVVAQQLGRDKEAAEHLAYAEAAHPGTVEALTTQALALKDRKGLELLTEAIQKKPFDPVLHRHRGQLARYVYFQEGATSDLVVLAISDFEKVLKAFPHDHATVNDLCHLLIFERRLIPHIDSRARCKELLDTWLESSPRDRDGLHCLMLYQRHFEGRLDIALEVGLKAHDSFPNDPMLVVQIGEIYKQTGRLEEAERFYTKSIELSQNHAYPSTYPQIQRGMVRNMLGKHDAARADLDQLRDLDDKSDWPAYFRGYLTAAYQQLGDLKTAESLAHEWVAVRSQTPEPHRVLAEIYVRQRREDEALSELSQAFALDPQAATLYHFAWVATYPESFDIITQAVERQPQDPALRRLRGQLACSLIMHMGKTERLIRLGVSDLESALKAFPTDRTILNPLVHILLYYGDSIPEVDTKTRTKELVEVWLDRWPDDVDGLRSLQAYYQHVTGEPEKAIAIGMKAHDLYPLRPIFLVKIAECYQWLRRFREAEDYFTKSIQVQRDLTWSYIHRGRCRIELDRPEAAREDFNQAGKCGDRLDWIQLDWSCLIDGYCRLGDMETAQTLCDDWIAKCPNTPHSYAQRADLYKRLGDHEKALADLEKAVQIAPGNPSFRERRAHAYCEAGFWQRAADDFAELIRLKPNRSELHYWRALAYLGAGDYTAYRSACAAMMQYYKEHETEFPGYLTAWTCLLAPDAVPDLIEAVQVAGREVAKTPLSGSHICELGALLYRAGSYEEAIAWMNEIAADESNDPSSPAYTWFLLAMAHYQLGNAEQGDTWFNKAQEYVREKTLDGNPSSWNRRLTHQLLQAEAESLKNSVKPRDGSSETIGGPQEKGRQNLSAPYRWILHLRKGQRSVTSGNVAEAAIAFSEAVKQRPEDWELRNLIARIYLDAKQWDEAINSYDKAIRLYPENKTALNRLAWLLATCEEPAHRDPEKALRLAEKAVSLDPRSGVWNTLGAARYRVGNIDGAIAAFMKAEELATDPYFAVNALYLAMAHWQQGNRQVAREWYQRGLERSGHKKPDDEALPRTRSEAEQVMGIEGLASGDQGDSEDGSK